MNKLTKIECPTNSVPLVELVEVEVSVLPPRAAPVGQNAAARHHHRPRFLNSLSIKISYDETNTQPQCTSTGHREGGTHLVGHGGGEVEVVRVVGGDSDLDAARPLLDEAVDPDLEELAVLERAVRHRHAVVELVVRPPALGGPAMGFRSKKDPQLGTYMYIFHL